MRLFSLFSLLVLGSGFSQGKTVVFWQDGFPTVGSEPVSRSVLEHALSATDPQFMDSNELAKSNAFDGVDLLVLPYGSAFPAENWPTISRYLQQGGNLLVLGGQPFRVPVAHQGGRFIEAQPDDAYSRELGILHTYGVPQHSEKAFAWKHGYEFLPSLNINANRFFVLEGHGLGGLGYMLDAGSEKVAAPVVVSNDRGARSVYLDFQAKPGYWESADGTSLVRAAADYAHQGVDSFWVETESSTWKPTEIPQAVVHFRELNRHQHPNIDGVIRLELRADDRVLATRQVPYSGTPVDTSVDFGQPFPPGFYIIHAVYSEAGQPRESYENGFWVEDEKLLTSGPALSVEGDFLTRDGKPFFPFGTNYFSTEENGWDFSGPRNAQNWEEDFAEMEKHGVSFVRTGVWNGQFKFLNQDGAVTERFLRNLEAYLLCAHQHHISVNFTFFAFDPQTSLRLGENNPVASLPGGNPYLDPVTIRAEQNYILSILNRFKDVPYLSWDLINEPSFSNPRHLWHGNTPNADPAETAAWQKWLAERYDSVDKLANAWSATPDQIGSFDSVALPNEHDLSSNLEYGDAHQVRAIDYNLFAQERFSKWVKQMVSAIRSTGSKQLIDVGQDEGGVTDRLLNQFYGHAGVSFTTNHTYRANSALLWDSLVAKVPGVANIVGETGYQPIILPNGDWQFDELTGASLIERKWLYGFAAGTSGALSWDWDRELYFGIKRSDGSSKLWEDRMAAMGKFAADAGPYATGFSRPDVAIVLPQSLQLSTLESWSVAAQQACVRALYNYARSDAYAVGEDQLQLIGNPKLIILPSPWILSDEAWNTLLAKVKTGATLLVSGPFDLDSHFRPTGRQTQIGIASHDEPLRLIQQQIKWPGGADWLTYSGQKSSLLEQAVLDNGSTFVEKPIGQGRILFVPLPLELNDNLEIVGAIYSYALKQAQVSPAYSTHSQNPGLTICPTRLPHATLYVVTSETSEPGIEFKDERSGKGFAGRLDPGRGALLLISEMGQILASYNWNSAVQ